MLGIARPWTKSLPTRSLPTLDRASRCLPSTGYISSRHGCTSSSLPSNILSSRKGPLLSTSWSARTRSISNSPQNRPSRCLTSSKSFSQPTSRHASSSSNNRWLNRQKSDPFTRATKLNNLKSRAAFKLLQINDRYHIFRPGQTVVDLGFAPGSWSQVAIDLVRPGLGRVVGVDVIPVAPPRGVNGLQGDFLSKHTQDRVRDLLRDEGAGRMRRDPLAGGDEAVDVQEDGSYIDRATASQSDSEGEQGVDDAEHRDRVVDVVLSDMSAPWDLPIQPYKKSVSNPYYRMMNTSGNRFKDHAGSMDLCRSALYFAHDTLKIGGHFICKFYQGAEDKQFERQLKAMFHKVHREKPESSRAESKESFFVGIKRLAKVDKNAVFDEGS